MVEDDLGATARVIGAYGRKGLRFLQWLHDSAQNLGEYKRYQLIFEYFPDWSKKAEPATQGLDPKYGEKSDYVLATQLARCWLKRPLEYQVGESIDAYLERKWDRMKRLELDSKYVDGRMKSSNYAI